MTANLIDECRVVRYCFGWKVCLSRPSHREKYILLSSDRLQAAIASKSTPAASADAKPARRTAFGHGILPSSGFSLSCSAYSRLRLVPTGQPSSCRSLGAPASDWSTKRRPHTPSNMPSPKCARLGNPSALSESCNRLLRIEALSGLRSGLSFPRSIPASTCCAERAWSCS